MMEDHQLGGKLLAGVSRSFYLTLKALPTDLREPLSVAYLLARAADTIADTGGIPEALKLGSLDTFGRLVQSPSRDLSGEAALAERLKAEIIPLQTDQDEALLLQRMGELFQAFHERPSGQQEQMRQVLRPIVEGQRLDIERFPVDGSIRALPKSVDLDTYTWLVAGCVGEFWTQLCSDVLGASFTQGASVSQMVDWGIRLGKGLQLVNILRDIGKDLSLGRCYFPTEELAAQGSSVEELKSRPEALLPLLPAWQQRCRAHLACGVEYVESLTHRRLRYATALPLLLALRTLALLESATWEQRMAGVKVSRGEVGKILFDASLAALRKDGIRKLAEKLK